MMHRFAQLSRRVLFSLGFATFASASQPQINVFEGFSALSQGDFEQVSLSSLGKISLAYGVDSIATSLPGSVTAVARGRGEVFYVATANPGKVWQVEKAHEPKLVFESDKPLISALAPLSQGELAIVVGPEGGVYRVRPGEWGKSNYTAIADVNLLLGAQASGNNLYLVGGGDTARLLRLSLSDNKVEVLASLEEPHFRSLHVDNRAAQDVVYFGSSERGVVYRYEKGETASIYFGGASEVTDIVQDAKGRIFVSFVDGESKMSDNAGKDAPKDDKASDVPHSSQVVRIDPNGEAEVLWQSKRDGAYALALRADEKQVLFGTGPHGLLYAVNASGGEGAQVISSFRDNDEIMSLIRGDKGRLYIGTAYEGGLYVLDMQARATQGSYWSEVLDMGALSQIGSLSLNNGAKLDISTRIFVRVGNSPIPDKSWGPFIERASDGTFSSLKKGRYAQIKVQLTRKSGSDEGPVLESVRLAYLNANRPPQIASLRVLPPNAKLEQRPPTTEQSRNVTLDEYAFATGGEPTAYAPEENRLGDALLKGEMGFRSIYAWAQDPDSDDMRYQFMLEKITGDSSQAPLLIKPWSQEPFVSFDSSTMADGRYRVWAQVDDMLTNGPARGLSDKKSTDVFEVANALPVFENVYAKRADKGVQVYFVARAKVPLALVQCSINGDDWLPVDPSDGMTDEREETYNTALPGKARFNSVSCRAFDENENLNRVDVVVKP